MKALKEIFVAIGFILVMGMVALGAWWAYDSYRHPRAEVDFSRYPVRGIDVSAHNGDISFPSVASSGIQFVWIKASEGETLRDRRYAANVRAARQAGLLTGAYHFFRFDCEGVLQAMNLVAALDGDIPPLGVAIDVEIESNPEDIPDEQVIDNLESMADYLQLKGIPVTIYTNKEAYNRYIAERLGNYPLWICSFTDNEPMEDDTPWQWWQYSHAGKIPGIDGKVDENVYNGPATDLPSP